MNKNQKLYVFKTNAGKYIGIRRGLVDDINQARVYFGSGAAKNSARAAAGRWWVTPNDSYEGDAVEVNLVEVAK